MAEANDSLRKPEAVESPEDVPAAESGRQTSEHGSASGTQTSGSGTSGEKKGSGGEQTVKWSEAKAQVRDSRLACRKLCPEFLEYLAPGGAIRATTDPVAEWVIQELESQLRKEYQAVTGKEIRDAGAHMHLAEYLHENGFIEITQGLQMIVDSAAAKVYAEHVAEVERFPLPFPDEIMERAVGGTCKGVTTRSGARRDGFLLRDVQGSVIDVEEVNGHTGLVEKSYDNDQDGMTQDLATSRRRRQTLLLQVAEEEARRQSLPPPADALRAPEQSGSEASYHSSESASDREESQPSEEENERGPPQEVWPKPILPRPADGNHSDPDQTNQAQGGARPKIPMAGEKVPASTHLSPTSVRTAPGPELTAGARVDTPVRSNPAPHEGVSHSGQGEGATGGQGAQFPEREAAPPAKGTQRPGRRSNYVDMAAAARIRRPEPVGVRRSTLPPQHHPGTRPPNAAYSRDWNTPRPNPNPYQQGVLQQVNDDYLRIMELPPSASRAGPIVPTTSVVTVMTGMAPVCTTNVCPGNGMATLGGYESPTEPRRLTLTEMPPIDEEATSDRLLRLRKGEESTKASLTEVHLRQADRKRYSRAGSQRSMSSRKSVLSASALSYYRQHYNLLAEECQSMCQGFRKIPGEKGYIRQGHVNFEQAIDVSPVLIYIANIECGEFADPGSGTGESVHTPSVANSRDRGSGRNGREGRRALEPEEGSEPDRGNAQQLRNPPVGLEDGAQLLLGSGRLDFRVVQDALEGFEGVVEKTNSHGVSRSLEIQLHPTEFSDKLNAVGQDMSPALARAVRGAASGELLRVALKKPIQDDLFEVRRFRNLFCEPIDLQGRLQFGTVYNKYRDHVQGRLQGVLRSIIEEGIDLAHERWPSPGSRAMWNRDIIQAAMQRGVNPDTDVSGMTTGNRPPLTVEESASDRGQRALAAEYAGERIGRSVLPEGSVDVREPNPGSSHALPTVGDGQQPPGIIDTEAGHRGERMSTASRGLTEAELAEDRAESRMAPTINPAATELEACRAELAVQEQKLREREIVERQNRGEVRRLRRQRDDAQEVLRMERTRNQRADVDPEALREGTSGTIPRGAPRPPRVKLPGPAGNVAPHPARASARGEEGPTRHSTPGHESAPTIPRGYLAIGPIIPVDTAALAREVDPGTGATAQGFVADAQPGANPSPGEPSREVPNEPTVEPASGRAQSDNVVTPLLQVLADLMMRQQNTSTIEEVSGRETVANRSDPGEEAIRPLRLHEIMKLVLPFGGQDSTMSWTRWQSKVRAMKRNHKMSENDWKTLIEGRLQGDASAIWENSDSDESVTGEQILAVLERHYAGPGSRDIAEGILDAMTQLVGETAKTFGLRVEAQARKAYPAEEAERHKQTRKRIRLGLTDQVMKSRFLDYTKSHPTATIADILEELNQHDGAAMDRMKQDNGVKTVVVETEGPGGEVVHVSAMLAPAEAAAPYRPPPRDDRPPRPYGTGSTRGGPMTQVPGTGYPRSEQNGRPGDRRPWEPMGTRARWGESTNGRPNQEDRYGRSPERRYPNQPGYQQGRTMSPYGGYRNQQYGPRDTAQAMAGRPPSPYNNASPGRPLSPGGRRFVNIQDFEEEMYWKWRENEAKEARRDEEWKQMKERLTRQEAIGQAASPSLRGARAVRGRGRGRGERGGIPYRGDSQEGSGIDLSVEIPAEKTYCIGCSRLTKATQACCNGKVHFCRECQARRFAVRSLQYVEARPLGCVPCDHDIRTAVQYTAYVMRMTGEVRPPDEIKTEKNGGLDSV